MNFQHYSNGKLLITGEYLVLYGALALALPVKFGQDIQINAGGDDSKLIWKAYEPLGEWFNLELSLPNLEIIDTSSAEKALFLQKILQKTRQLNNGFLIGGNSLKVKTYANFPVNWGLGTSSSLINNIAQWASVDPFKLHSLVSKGSGYDIACADNNSAIFYQIEKGNTPKVVPVDLQKNFQQHIYFIYSGKKKSTESHIEKFINQSISYEKETELISQITREIVNVGDLKTFIQLILEHEKIIASVLNTTPLGTYYFSNFDGVVKSLGAWGGDFLLAASPSGPEYVKKYFEQFGLSAIIPYSEMVIK